MARFPGSIDPRTAAAPYPVVVAEPSGAIRALDDAARSLFPAACPGAGLDVAAGWLAQAHAPLAQAPAATSVSQTAPPPSGWVDERSLEAHPTRHDDGSVTWWLVDDTDVRLARDALQVERSRTAFLGELTTALLGSLNLPRCMAVAAELATEHLCEAVWVLAPGGRGRYPTVFRARGGEPHETQLKVDNDEVPGLAEALRGFPPVPSRRLDPASVPDWVGPEQFREIGSVVVTQLPGHGVPAGAMVLLRSTAAPPFGDDEEIIARLFAARAGAAMSAAVM